MSYTIAFYVHHHGSGHFMRSLAIARALKHDKIVFLGSDLSRFSNILPDNIQVFDLPMDTPLSTDSKFTGGSEVDCFHYAPLQVLGVSERAAMMTKLFVNNSPLLLMVDVSVEVALLARLSGVPTIVIRQHGNRTDLPHRLAYQSAELLIAPFGKELETSKDVEVLNKTFYSGGFSRYAVNQIKINPFKDQIGVIIGKGGTSITLEVITHIAKQCQDQYFHILGEIELSQQVHPLNITFHGLTDNVEEILSRCALVIGNLGHNTVMEIATINRSFIGIPENRPFDEQLDKARAMTHIKGFTMVLPEHVYLTDWKDIVESLLELSPTMDNLINPDALDEIAVQVKQLAKRLF
jgi:hypothetical protein